MTPAGQSPAAQAPRHSRAGLEDVKETKQMTVRTLRVTLDVEVRDMTAAELAACDDGLGADDEDGDGAPTVTDYAASEIAELIPSTLAFDEVQDEMFAGTAIYARIAGVKVAAAEWTK